MKQLLAKFILILASSNASLMLLSNPALAAIGPTETDNRYNEIGTEGNSSNQAKSRKIDLLLIESEKKCKQSAQNSDKDLFVSAQENLTQARELAGETSLG